MQSLPLIDPALVVMAQGLIAFIGLVSYGLYRYSRGVRYKLWALGWTIFTTTTGLGTVFGGVPLDMFDSLSTSGMLLGSVLLFDGANEHRREGRSLLIYFLAAAVGFVVVPVGMVLDVSYSIPYTIVGGPTALSCWYSARKFREDETSKGLDFWTAYVGLVVWGISTLVFIPFSLLNLLSLHVLVISIGVMATGAGLLSFFIKKTTESLDTQYQISQLLGSILNHDIRNYVGSLSGSIEQAIASDKDREMWLELASEIITAMMDFVEEVRYLTATVTRVQSEKTPMNLARIIEGVSERVIREYNLEPENIVVELDENVHILTCGLVKEMFWNIFDNAFRHGTQKLTVRAMRESEEDVIVEISDTAGGIPTEIQNFLNDPHALSSQSAPGVGLGIILIRSLAALCSIPMKVEDIVDNDEQVVGSLYQLQFKYKDPDILDE